MSIHLDYSTPSKCYVQPAGQNADFVRIGGLLSPAAWIYGTEVPCFEVFAHHQSQGKAHKVGVRAIAGDKPPVTKK